MDHRRLFPFIFSTLFLAFVCDAGAQTAMLTKVPSIDQSLEMRTVAVPKISPDGRRVVYEQSRTNWETNAFDTDLWVADVATGEGHP